jgi:CubicO group peptidase (beta-lactamase class C family)
MEVEESEPHRVRRFEILAIPTPDELLPPRISEGDAIKALRGEIERAVAEDRFSGAVLVAKDGVPTFAEAYGFGDRERKIPNQLDTRFRIGSMNKMFTAVATLQLVQARKLELTTPLAEILPTYPNKNLASKVTIHHLLTHTGGTGTSSAPTSTNTGSSCARSRTT